MVLLLYMFYTVPFLKEKIIREFNQNPEEAIAQIESTDNRRAIGRFASFQVRWKDFKKHPILGLGGGSYKISYTNQKDIKLGTINGLANIMAIYGLFGLVIFFIFSFITGKWFSSLYNFEGFWIFPALIFIISFGFGIVLTPLFFLMWFLSAFKRILNKKMIYSAFPREKYNKRNSKLIRKF